MQKIENIREVWCKISKIMEEKNMLSIVIMSVLGIMVYFFFGEWIFLEDDSYTYMKLRIGGGVMPVYPMLLKFVQGLVGIDHYLNVMVIFQSGLAIVCTLVFTLMLQKVVRFHNIERIPVFVMCMLPYMIDMPQVAMTHYILTEGISYSLFYIYFIFLLKAIWTNKYIWFVVSYGLAFLLALTRSQLIILFIICGVAFVYICFRRESHKVNAKVGRVIVGTLVAVVLMLGGYKAVYGVCGILENKQRIEIEQNAAQEVNEANVELSEDEVMKPNIALTRSQIIILITVCGVAAVYVCFRKMPYEIRVRAGRIILGAVAALLLMFGGYKAIKGIGSILENKQREEEANVIQEVKFVDTRSTDNQVTALILIRGFFEADESDVELFEDEMMRFIFKEAYRIAKENGHLYSEKEDIFNISGDLCNGFIIAKIEKAIAKYDEQFPGMRNRTYDQILREMGIKILLHHFGRFVLHAIILMLPSFVSSIFFRKVGFETVCGIIALVLYLAAIVLCIINIRRKEEKYVTEGMLATLAFIVILVGVINVIFVGHQRYVVYTMGIFYVFLYLLFRNIVREFISSRIRCAIGKK